MALTPLNYETSNSAFRNKLGTVVGAFQNLQASQLQKRQMAEQLSAQKELIDYRAEAQQEAYQQKSQAQMQQDMIEQFNESMKGASEEVKELSNEFSKREYSTLSDFNMGTDFRFDVKVQEDGDGNVTGVGTKIEFMGQEIDYQTYKKNILPTYRSFAEEFLKPLQENEVVDPTNPETNKQYIGPLQKEEYISRIKTDQEFRYKEFQKYANGQLGFETSEGESSGGGKATITKNVVPTIGQMKQEFKGNVQKQYTWREDTWKPFDESAGAFSVNYGASVSSVKQQIETAIRSGMLGNGSQFSLGSLSSEQRQKLALGQLTSEEIDAIPASMRDDVETLNEASGDSTRQTLQDLVKNYNRWTQLYTAYANDTDQAYRPDQIQLDLWNAPTDLKGEDAYRQIFKPITEDLSDASVSNANKQNLLNMVNNINRDVGAWSSWNN